METSGLQLGCLASGQSVRDSGRVMGAGSDQIGNPIMTGGEMRGTAMKRKVCNGAYLLLLLLGVVMATLTSTRSAFAQVGAGVLTGQSDATRGTLKLLSGRHRDGGIALTCSRRRRSSSRTPLPYRIPSLPVRHV